MDSISLQNIYEDYKANYKDESDYTIDFYKSNTDFFKSIKIFESEEDLKCYVFMVCKYVEALYKIGHYNNAINEANKVQSIIDNEISRLIAYNIKDGWYYGIALIKGMATYKLKDYKNSTKIFKDLVEADDENDNYKMWFEYSRNGQKQWFLNIISYVFLLFMLSDIFFADYLIKKKSDRLTVSCTLFIVWLAFLFYQYTVKHNFRKKNPK